MGKRRIFQEASSGNGDWWNSFFQVKLGQGKKQCWVLSMA